MFRLKTTATTTEDDGIKFDCDFQDSDCGWSVASEDPEFSWMRTTHDTCTESHLDCPTSDLTSPAEGYYMYVDGARGSKEIRAELMSPGGATPTDDCFLFYFILSVSQTILPKIERSKTEVIHYRRRAGSLT